MKPSTTFSTFNAVVALLTTSLILLAWIHPSQGIAEQEVGLGIDGLRCDSCGADCSTYCGSRAFRTCCFNYIKKKRSINGSPPPSILSFPSMSMVRAQAQQGTHRRVMVDPQNKQLFWSSPDPASSSHILGVLYNNPNPSSFVEEDVLLPPNNSLYTVGGGSSSH